MSGNVKRHQFAVPLCKDCRHAKLDNNGSYLGAKCTAVAPRLSSPSLVTGEISPPEYWYCSTERSSLSQSAECGPAGKLFEPKPEPKHETTIKKRWWQR